MSNAGISVYLDLIQAFLSNRISAKEFETLYLSEFKSQQGFLPTEEYLVLDELFADIDAFVSDPLLREAEDLNEDQLRARCEVVLKKLIHR